MTLKPIDDQHFYLDNQLIDLAWIAYQVKQQTTAANYHDMHRNLRWLTKFAERLMAGEAECEAADKVRRALTILGYGWYFNE